MAKLTTAQAKTIEEMWSDIPSLKRQLNFREWELTENKTVDENIGGGKGNKISDTTGNKAILLAEDERYQKLKKDVEAIEFVIAKVRENKKDHLLCEFMKMKYLSSDSNYLDWEDVADELGIMKTKGYKLRNKLIDMTAKKLGWI
ncbi:MAG: hypothetical protein ABS882_03535 [Lysinibacillus sp.]